MTARDAGASQRQVPAGARGRRVQAGLSRRQVLAGLAVPALAGLTACAQPPTGNAKAGDRSSGEAAYRKLYAKLDGLSAGQRRDTLAGLARKEGALTVYTSNTTMPKVVKVFEKAFRIDCEVYRAQSQVVSQRAHSEAQSGRIGSDILDNTAEYQYLADQEGVVVGYRGPAHEGLPEIAVGTGFAANQYTVFAVAWNSKLVAKRQRPASYQDLTDSRWRGKLLIDPRHDAMYYALRQHFLDEGTPEREFTELFRKLGRNAVPMEGGTPRANSVVSGEHSASLGSFIHEVDEQASSGAPITWEPAVEPMYVEPVGSALVADAPHPAAALLFYEWIQDEGQKELASLSRVTHQEFVSGGRLDGLTVLQIDYGEYVRHRQKWQDEYHDLIGYQ